MGDLSGPEAEKPGALEIEMLRQSREEWQRYQTVFKENEKDFIDRVRSYDTAESRQGVVNTATNTARHNIGNLAPPPGTTPGGPAFKRALVDSENLTGRALGQASVAGEQAAEDKYINGVNQLVRIGRGLSGSADAGLAHASAMEAGNIASDTAYSNANRVNNQQMVGEVAGAGIYAGGANAGWWGPNSGSPNLDTSNLGAPINNARADINRRTS